MRRRKAVELIHEGKYAAEVEIELEYTDESWSPTMSGADALKLEAVMLALRQGDIAEAAKHGRVFQLTPVARSSRRGREGAVARKRALGLDPSVTAGPPEAVVKEKRSYTGAFLKPVLARRGAERRKGMEAAK